MKTFMEAQFLSFLPILIQEFVDFKSFIQGYVVELAGLKKIYISMCFMDKNE